MDSIINNFVHLHVHSEYSLVDSVARIKPLVTQCAALAMPALAITDLSNMSATVKFYQAALAAGIKPIIGAECLVYDDTQAKSPFKIVLICQNVIGYRHLSNLVSLGYTQGQLQATPMLQKAWLAKYHDGLILLSNHEGDVGRALLNHRHQEALVCLQFWQNIFPKRFYLEISRTGRAGEESYLHEAVKLATQQHIPLVATNNVCFLHRQDFEAHEAKVCIQQGWVLSDSRRPRHYRHEQYLRSAQEMIELFADIPEAISNTLAIAKRCNLSLQFNQSFLPDLPVLDGLSNNQQLVKLAQSGLEDRLACHTVAPDKAIYQQRLDHELKVILDMGFSSYFLIVADFVQWAKDHDIAVGPGRGSGAGSLVAYVMGITDLDPIYHQLLFERFLNPERISMPDFDIDFCAIGRDRVIEYVTNRYGKDRVSQIVTYGTMAARGVVRDVARVLGQPYGLGDKIAKRIPLELGVTLDKALKEPDLKQLYDEDEEARNIIDLAQKLEGLPRNISKHAGGVVIAPSALTDFTPLFCEAGNHHPMTQLDKDDIEAAGLVKFDFLGLKTLTIIDWTLKNINRLTQQAIDISQIDLDDPKTFELLRSCNTTALFQLESHGVRDLIKRLQPDCFEDIVALVALFRPGPLKSGMVEDFINRKHGRAVVEYPHPSVKPVLQATYGVILYQEQVMQIAQVLAGYTLGDADLLRRAMGKKKPSEMAKQRAIFITGTNGQLKERQANHIFDLMEKFAEYGFNKSHSVAYALLAYQTAWLKAHYSSAFMASVLSADIDNTDKMLILVNACRQMNITVMPPNLNQSDYLFIAKDKNTIIYGLGAIKGVGEGVVNNIVTQRQQGGLYRDLYDLCIRCDVKKLNRRAIQSLIQAGATDCFDSNRAALLDNLDECLQLANQYDLNKTMGQTDLFGLAAKSSKSQTPSRSQKTPCLEKQRLSAEKTALGFYLTAHPLDHYEEEIQQLTTHRLAEVAKMEFADLPQQSGHSRLNQTVRLGGLIDAIQIRHSRRGRFANIILDDKTGRLELSVFHEVLQQCKHCLSLEHLVIAEGELMIDRYNGQVGMNVKSVVTLEQARTQHAKYLRLDMDRQQVNHQSLAQLHQLFQRYQEGHCPVRIFYTNQKASTYIQLGKHWQLTPKDDLIWSLKAFLGKQAVKTVF